MSLLRLIAVLLAAVPLLAHAQDKVRVSSFSTILTEIAQQVGGDQVEVTAHVKPGIDPHEFEPKPADLKTVSQANLILLSAKHMEGYVGNLKQATGTKGNLVEVGDQFPSLKLAAGGHDHDHDHAKDSHGEIEDPHWWHSITNIKRATNVVRDELIKVSPANKDVFTKNAAAYTEKLNALEKWCRSEIAKLPRNQRKLVTSHDAFQYLAKDFGFTMYPVEGISSADQPSSKKVSELIKTVKAQGVKAIFAEKLQNPKVLTEITRETGAKLGGELYADGLGEGDASTIDGMFRHNISTIVNALK
jgi:ABC-type Zn uptake system ZnuABC Zn-binding protein ZnuA